MVGYLVINGPNLNLLGLREPGIYGQATLADVEKLVRIAADELGVSVEFYQSNHEGSIIDRLHEARQDCAGIVFNPGAYSHYSYAIRDALSAIKVPCVEVHISNIHKREEFRHTSVVSPVVVGQIAGLGIHGYELALRALVKMSAVRE